MSDSPQGRVTRRRVFYIPGYDPVPARRYREIYRREGAEQAAISGYRISLRHRPDAQDYGWHVSAEIDGAEVETDVEMLIWSDLVRASMPRGVAASYLQLLRAARVYIGFGVLPRLLRLRKGPVIAALYPVIILIAQILFASGAGILLARVLSSVVPWPVGWAAGGALWAWLLVWFKRHDNRLYAHYLMHDYAFSARGGGEYPPELQERLEQFRDRIEKALQSDVDEVLVVGHSSGAHLAVSVLSDVIRRGAVPKRRPVLALLTLGQVVPMASFLPRAWQLRDDLHFLAARHEITWVDVTAPGDGCTFALCDPVSVSGVAPVNKLWPLVFSAAFSRTLSPERLRRLRWRFFRLHFQYIHAFDRPGDYDYFRITAGPLTLAARYGARPASRSRIERAMSPYTDRAA